MSGNNHTPYLHLAYGPDSEENRNWELLDTKAFNLARSLIENIPAGGDLTGFYPDPLIADGAVQDSNIESVSWGKITGFPGSAPSGPAGGDLIGDYPDPLVRDGVIDINNLDPVLRPQLMPLPVFPTDQGKVLTSEVGTGIAKWLPPAGGAPSGTAGGDLSGTYPNPTVVQASSAFAVGDGLTVTAGGIAVLAGNSVFPTLGVANELLTGTLTVVGRATLGIDPVNPLDAATKQYVDARTATGSAGGDLTGSYPNPTIAPGAVGNAEISDVAYSKITGAPVIPTTLPPSGAAGGDLAGTYPDPTIGPLKVTTAAIAALAVTRAKVAADAWLSPIPVGGDVGKVLTVAAGPTLAWSAPGAAAIPNPVIVGGDLIKARLAESPSQDWALLTLNEHWNGSAWVQDDPTKVGWMNRMAVAEDNWAVIRSSSGGSSIQNMLVCDNSGFLTALGGLISPGVNTVAQLNIGPGTYKARMRVYQHALTLNVNTTDFGTQDDNTRPSWNETFDLSGDAWTVARRPPAGGSTTHFSLSGSTGKLTATLADSILTRSMVTPGHSIWSNDGIGGPAGTFTMTTSDTFVSGKDFAVTASRPVLVMGLVRFTISKTGATASTPLVAVRLYVGGTTSGVDGTLSQSLSFSFNFLTAAGHRMDFAVPISFLHIPGATATVPFKITAFCNDATNYTTTIAANWIGVQLIALP